jgi:hypothetical protein
MSYTPDDRDTNRRAAAVNELLSRIGLSNGAETEWWNHRAYKELGGYTPTQAWLRGDHRAVEDLVADWYRATEQAVEHYRSDPKFMERLHERRATIAEQVKRTA